MNLSQSPINWKTSLTFHKVNENSKIEQIVDDIPKKADARSVMESTSNRPNADCVTTRKIMADKKNELLQFIVWDDKMPIVL